MDNIKWLKRKYPESFEMIHEFLDEKELSFFKKGKYKIGRITEDTIYVQKYPPGTLIYFKRSNPIMDENYPMHYAVAKCGKELTSSGYHSIHIFESNFEEIYK